MGSAEKAHKKGKKRATTKKINWWISTHWRRAATEKKKKIDLTGWNLVTVAATWDGTGSDCSRPKNFPTPQKGPFADKSLSGARDFC